MASQESTPTRPAFQPRPGVDGLAARYLLFRLTEKTIVTPDGCWTWTGTTNNAGYALLHIRSTSWPESTVSLHRLAYEVCIGPIPDGQCVLHRCDNPPCLRPDHLFLGTNYDNTADKVAKGRQASGETVRLHHEHLKGEVIRTSRFSAEQIMEMRRRDAAGEHPLVIAADFSTTATYVVAVARGDCWTHLPLLYRGNRKNRPCPKCGRVFPTRQGIFYKHVVACGNANIDLVLGKE